MAILIISDKPQEEWARFLMDSAEKLGKYKIRSLAVVALIDAGPEEITAATGYHNMALRDMAEAAAHIQADITDRIVRANIEKYMEELGRDDEI